MELNSKNGSVVKKILYQLAAFKGSKNFYITDGNDLLVLEFLALVIRVTVLKVIPGKFEQLVLVSSAYPNLDLTVTVFDHYLGT
jgi:hypothetical protein